MDDVTRGTDTATVVRKDDDGNVVPDRAAIDAQIANLIQKDKLDPRQQWYLKNVATGRLIRKEADYHRALENHHQVARINYNQALNLFNEEEAERKAAERRLIKRKSVQRARKRNRG